MTEPCILICNDLALHREVLLGTLRVHRPHLRAHVVAPAEVAAVPGCADPRLVVCSDLSVVERLRPDAFILLYPGDENLAYVGIGGRLRTLFSPTVPQLLGVIDEVWPVPVHPNE